MSHPPGILPVEALRTPQPYRPPALPTANKAALSNTSSPQPPSSSSSQSGQRSGGLRTPSNRKTIYDRNLNRTRNNELSRASFAYLFSEMVQYAQRRVTGIQDLEKRLNQQGYPLGVRLLPLLLHRLPTPRSTSALPTPSALPTQTTRPIRILPLLQFITTTLWRALFSKPADALERSSTNEDEYMISDNEPLVNSYISIPKEMSQLNCAAFVAGVIEGVCDAAGLTAGVTAHNAGTDMWPGKTIFLIRFDKGVREREAVVEKIGK
ncbi:Trafficking protein particle complex subunit 5 [Agyrium rufum]|nr:Trafficking protein particle complex subunit 5 [Agyrium rufum]